MKKLFSIPALLMFISITGFSQNKTFGKFLGSQSPNKFIGNSMYKGYEKQINVVEVTTAGQNQSTTITIKFDPCQASTDFLANAQSRGLIKNGDITTLFNDPNLPVNAVKGRIYFEDATIISCTTTQACNGAMATTVQLKPQRICWIYNNYSSGKLLNTTNSGFDAKSGQPWSVTPPNF